MTETPRPQGSEPEEPSTGSTQFTPGRPTTGASRPASSGGAAGSSSGSASPSGTAGTADSDTSGASGSGSPSTTTQDPSPSSAPATAGQPSAATGDDPLARTRVSGIWIGIIVFTLILILLLVFVIQNTRKVEISYFWFDGHIPLAVAMLLSAAAGVLLTAIAGTLRILQLRKRLKANTS